MHALGEDRDDVITARIFLEITIIKVRWQEPIVGSSGMRTRAQSIDALPPNPHTMDEHSYVPMSLFGVAGGTNAVNTVERMLLAMAVI